METEASVQLAENKIVLARKDILGKIRKHHNVIETMLADANLILETFQAANKEEHVQMFLDYTNTLIVLDDTIDYIESCMTIGVARTVEERQNDKQEGGE